MNFSFSFFGRPGRFATVVSGADAVDGPAPIAPVLAPEELPLLSLDLLDLLSLVFEPDPLELELLEPELSDPEPSSLKEASFSKKGRLSPSLIQTACGS